MIYSLLRSHGKTARKVPRQAFKLGPYGPSIDSTQTRIHSQRQTMARCEICLKSGQSGNNVSHSKRHTRRRWAANVRKATISIDGAPKRINICTRCLRTKYKVLAKA